MTYLEAYLVTLKPFFYQGRRRYPYFAELLLPGFKYSVNCTLHAIRCKLDLPQYKEHGFQKLRLATTIKDLKQIQSPI